MDTDLRRFDTVLDSIRVHPRIPWLKQLDPLKMLKNHSTTHKVQVGCETDIFVLGCQGEAIVGGRLSVEAVIPEIVQASTSVDAAESQDVFGS